MDLILRVNISKGFVSQMELTSNIHHHPSLNGLTEKSVSTIKHGLRKQLFNENKNNSIKSMQHKVDNFLLSYKNTP